MTEPRGLPLTTFLNELQLQYHRKDLLSSDPLEFVHLYPGKAWDQEVVALIAALLAYGNVKQVRKSVSDALARLSRLSDSPADVVRRLGGMASDPEFLKALRRELGSFVHRFNVGPDLVLLLQLLSESWRRYGSLGAHFLTHLEPGQDITEALSVLIRDWNEWIEQGRAQGVLRAALKRDSFRYLLTSPADGSCCKRWCMLLRWMGRKDEIDPGLWTEVSGLSGTFPKGRALDSSQLVLPLDTHTGRISQYLGLTRRKTLDWKAALEITQSLAACDSRDPTRYDFALSRLGILSICRRKFRPEICTRCQLVPVCKFARNKVAK